MVISREQKSYGRTPLGKVVDMISHKNYYPTHYPTRIGGSTRVTALKANQIEDKEPGESSKIVGRPSSNKSLLPKSVSTIPKLGASSSSKLKKTCKVQPNSTASGQPSSTRNLSARLGQIG